MESSIAVFLIRQSACGHLPINSQQSSIRSINAIEHRNTDANAFPGCNVDMSILMSPIKLYHRIMQHILLGARCAPSKIQEVTLMRPFHGNL